MRTLMLTAVALLAAAPAAARDQPIPGQPTGGKPVSCIQQSMIDSTRIFDSGQILYRMKAGNFYLNSPTPKCHGLTRNNAIASRVPTGQLCSGDILHVFDPRGIDYPGCPLAEFVPYTRSVRP